MIDDNDTPTCQRTGEGHSPGPDRQHRLARGAEEVDTAMAWVPSLVGWSEGCRDRGCGLQRPHPGLATGSCLSRRGQRHDGSEHGDSSGESYVEHRPSVGRGALGGVPLKSELWMIVAVSTSCGQLPIPSVRPVQAGALH